MTLTLHGFPVSNYYNKVKMALLEKGDIDHVTVGRADHHRRALHDVVAGEQQLLAVKQIA